MMNFEVQIIAGQLEYLYGYAILFA